MGALRPWDGSIPCHPIDGARIVYVEVPKAGCTSIKLALAHLKGGPPQPDEDVHHWYSYTWAADVAELYRWFDTRWRRYLRFTVVRDPVERFESFFYGLESGGSINRYVRGLRLDRVDIHAAPQSLIVGPEPGRFDFIGRTDRMDRVELALAGRAGPVAIPHANRSAGERRALTPLARARLESLYADDRALLARVA